MPDGKQPSEAGTYSIIRVPTGTVDSIDLNVCDLCGTIVYALGKHTEWHQPPQPET
jgi:hypothetical protein